MTSDKTTWMKCLAFSFFLLLISLFAFACNPILLTPKTPIPPCASPSETGVLTSNLGHIFGLGSGNLLAQAITLSAPTTAFSITVDLIGYGSIPNTGQVWSAIYQDNGANAPGSLVGASNPQNVVTGLNALSLPNLALPASGSTIYWLTLQLSNNSNFAPENPASNIVMIAPHSWGAFPSTFPASPTSFSACIEIYVSTCP